MTTLPEGNTVCTQCGYDASKVRPEPFAEGTVLEQRYRIDSEVGRGGMGVVYQGTDLTLSRPVAIKALTATHANADTIDQFMREARALASVEHSKVVPVYAVGRHGGCYFMVMKFISGQPLSEILKTRGALPPDEVKDLLGQTLEALAALHARGLLHRDLKPGNLMIGDDGRVTVMDLGISKKLGDVDQGTSTALGTPRYMPPEMINELEEDARADLYSLGVIAWQALVGRPPFDGPTPMSILYKQAHEPAEPLRSAAPQVPKDLADVVDQALQKNPEDRPPSAEAMAEALRGVQPGTVSRRVMAFIMVVFLVAGGLTMGWWLNHTESLNAEDVGVAAAKPDLGVDAKVEAKVVDARVVDAAVDAVVVDAAKPKPVPIIKVKLKLTSTPSGAAVFHRSRRLGRTPLTIERPLSQRSITLSFERSGFGKVKRTVRIKKGAKLHVTLKPLFDLVP